ncbi:hypothetical protein BDN67DRAFT_971632 [Paxillus ammoniavirescens]|nr:hypothetical protein BDN67DRAFT_971632 [Paxillus ammoniavirescens]
MKTFLTLLAVVTSLSAYTLVGVHASCAVCPQPTEANVWLKSTCTRDRSTSEQVPMAGRIDPLLLLQRAYSLIHCFSIRLDDGIFLLAGLGNHDWGSGFLVSEDHDHG